MSWFERHSVSIHLAVIAVGVASFVGMCFTGDARLLAVVIASAWYTVST